MRFAASIVLAFVIGFAAVTEARTPTVFPSWQCWGSHHEIKSVIGDFCR